MNWFGFELSAFLAIFIVLNIVNVIMQTVKSIATIKCGAWAAASINALAYGLYTIVVIYMNADGLGIVWKAIIIGLANLLGVYIVKILEAKNRKDKLWKVECTVKKTHTSALDEDLKILDIPHHYTIAGNHTVFNCYCATQAQSLAVKRLCDAYEAKYFVAESKVL